MAIDRSYWLRLDALVRGVDALRVALSRLSDTRDPSTQSIRSTVETRLMRLEHDLAQWETRLSVDALSHDLETRKRREVQHAATVLSV